jgi:hypothetical protein
MAGSVDALVTKCPGIVSRRDRVVALGFSGECGPACDARQRAPSRLNIAGDMCLDEVVRQRSN